MVFPGGEVFRAVDRNTATFWLLLSLSLAKSVELVISLTNCYATGMGVDEVAIGIKSFACRNDVFGVGQNEEAEKC